MKNRGFTLIEILISITIIILFSGITLAYYNNFTEDQKLKSESKRLVSVLALAQKMASSGYITDKTNCDVTGNYVFDGYKVNFISDNIYTLNQTCSLCTNTVCLPIDPIPVPIHTYNFDHGIKVQNLTPPSILFKPLSLGATMTPSDNKPITITNSLKCIDITIGLSTIEESGIKPCTTP